MKRPSRFDRVFHVGLPTEAERREYCRRLLSRSGLLKRISEDLDEEALAEEVASRAGGFTPAHLKEAFAGAALELAYEGETALIARSPTRYSRTWRA